MNIGKPKVIMHHFLIRIVLAISLLLSTTAFAQIHQISGVVRDADTRMALAFVNIVFNGKNAGTSTDIDGKFTIVSNAEVIKNLKISYVGYEPLVFDVDPNPVTVPIEIKLKRQDVLLGEVVIRPGENPAERLIKIVSANRHRNNPENLESFSYVAYNKMHFTIDTAAIDSGATSGKPVSDSSEIRLKAYLEDKYLFLMESVSERKYLKPNRNSEKVLASRVSGLKEPSFAILATQLQSFSFYNDFIAIADRKYLNPVAPQAFSKYLYLPEDTIYSGNDSVFIISFAPRKGKNFDGLKGLLYINSRGYAIQNVIAQTPGEGDLDIRIQQKHELKGDSTWFPEQLNTTIVFKNLKANNHYMTGIGRSYLTQVIINPPFRNREFGHVELEIMPKANTQTEDFWNKFRADSLDLREMQTYHTVDSIGKAKKFDAKLKTFSALASGRIPVKIFDLEIDQFIKLSNFEAVRLGAGFRTNRKLSEYFSFGAFYGYGFKDKKSKYGASAEITPFRNDNFRVVADYTFDLVEAGGVSFARDRRPTLEENYRDVYLGRRDYRRQYGAAIGFRTLRYLQTELGIRQQDYTTTALYAFNSEQTQSIMDAPFHFTEIYAGFRYAFREKYFKNGRDEIKAGTNFPVLYAGLARGISSNSQLFNGDFKYLRFDFKAEYSFSIPLVGKQRMQLLGGFTDESLPYSKLYNARGSFHPKYPVASPNSFETMSTNEFLSDRYINLFHTHSFGSLLLKTKKFKPEISIVNNIGFGSLANGNAHLFRQTRSYSKGYFETGFRFDSVLRLNFTSLGAGVFYRYGAYASSTFQNNLAAKLAMVMSF